ncbi:MAG: molybdenum cofactor biosynthesis protein MoaE [Myxococcota bacterium]
MSRLSDVALTVAPLLAAVRDPRFGAELVFYGVTRNHHDGRPVLRLEYEAYPELAEPELAALVTEAEGRWPCKVALVHRVGVVPQGEPSVIICVAAAHRAEAYEASRWVIDTLKERVPIWKREVYEDGASWRANASS